MSRAARAGAGYAVSVVVLATGAGLEFGAGWGLMVAGLVSAVSLLLLVDVGEG